VNNLLRIQSDLRWVKWPNLMSQAVSLYEVCFSNYSIGFFHSKIRFGNMCRCTWAARIYSILYNSNPWIDIELESESQANFSIISSGGRQILYSYVWRSSTCTRRNYTDMVATCQARKMTLETHERRRPKLQIICKFQIQRLCMEFNFYSTLTSSTLWPWSRSLYSFINE
jgi:hypothetical protein